MEGSGASPGLQARLPAGSSLPVCVKGMEWLASFFPFFRFSVSKCLLSLQDTVLTLLHLVTGRAAGEHSIFRLKMS